MQRIRRTDRGIQFTSGSDGSEVVTMAFITDKEPRGMYVGERDSFSTAESFMRGRAIKRTGEVSLRGRDSIHDLYTMMLSYVSEEGMLDGFVVVDDAKTMRVVEVSAQERVIVIFVAYNAGARVEFPWTPPEVTASSPHERCDEYGIEVPDGYKPTIFIRQQHDEFRLTYAFEEWFPVPLEMAFRLAQTIQANHGELQPPVVSTWSRTKG